MKALVAERTKAYTEIQKTLIDDVVYIPLFSRKDYVATRMWVYAMMLRREPQ